MNQYIGVPYKSRGRDFKGADCYGILCLVYEHEMGVMLPEHEYCNATKPRENKQVFQEGKEVWQEIPREEVKPLDVVSFNVTGVEAHIGIIIDPKSGIFLHTLSQHDSGLGRLDSLMWDKRIAGFYRHHDFLQTSFFQVRHSENRDPAR